MGRAPETSKKGAGLGRGRAKGVGMGSAMTIEPVAWTRSLLLISISSLGSFPFFTFPVFLLPLSLDGLRGSSHALCARLGFVGPIGVPSGGTAVVDFVGEVGGHFSPAWGDFRMAFFEPHLFWPFGGSMAIGSSSSTSPLSSVTTIVLVVCLLCLDFLPLATQPVSDPGGSKRRSLGSSVVSP